MVVAYHLVWTAYGWWLPNDPRGSMSRYVQSDLIAELGTLHFGRKRIQPASRIIREFYDQVPERLKFPLESFDPTQCSAIAEAFATEIQRQGYTCYACAIMPDHVHVLIRKHKHRAEEMIANLQASSRERLIALGFRENGHPVWGGPGWKVFLDTRADIERTIRYIEQNPVKMRKPVQRWDFVTPYDGWLPGIVKKVPPGTPARNPPAQ